MSGRPPVVARLLLAAVGRVVPGPDREHVLADLREAFDLRRARSGTVGAHAWLLGQAFREVRAGVRIRREDRRSRSGGPVGQVTGDVRFAVRSFASSPVFTLVSGSTLALGIGGALVMFALVDGVLLRPLPYEDPDELVLLTRSSPDFSGVSFSYPDFDDVRTRASGLDGVAALRGWGFAVRSPEGALLRQVGASVSWDYFRILGVEPALGRFFGPDEGRPGHAPVVVVSSDFWTEILGAATDAVGRTIELSGETYTVIGVAPPGFEDPVAASSGVRLSPPRAWRSDPPTFDAAAQSRTSYSVWAVARLRDGVDAGAAATELSSISEGLAESFPDAIGDQRFGLVGLKEARVGGVAGTLTQLLAGVGMLLLIACTNVANLFLARATQRRREMSIRTAMGAGRSRLLAQLMTESLVFALAAGLGGLALAAAGLEVVEGPMGGWLPRSGDVALDLRVVGAALGLAVLTSLFFGLAPAVHGVRSDPADALRHRTGSDTAEGRLRNLFAGSQVALAAVLLVGAGLLVRSLVNLQRADLGVETDPVLAVDVIIPSDAFPSRTEQDAVVASIVDRVLRIPGVVGAGTINTLPMSGRMDSTPVVRADAVPASLAGLPYYPVRTVTPGYFQAVGMRIVRGRGIQAADRPEDPPVAVINEALANRLFLDEDPLESGIVVRGTELTVVGVVADVRQFGPQRAPEPAVYTAYPQETQSWMRSEVHVTFRHTEGAPPSITAIRSAVAEVSPALWVGTVVGLADLLDRYLAEPRFRMALTAFFGLLALLLTGAGVAAVVGYAVARRTHEFAVRAVCGAKGHDLVASVVTGSLRFAALGLSAGLLVAALLAPSLEGVLHGIGPWDPFVFAATALVLASALTGASLVPAVRATRIEPSRLLREE